MTFAGSVMRASETDGAVMTVPLGSSMMAAPSNLADRRFQPLAAGLRPLSKGDVV